MDIIIIIIIIQLFLNYKLVSDFSFILEAGIPQWYSAGLQAGWLGVQVLAGAGNFTLRQHVHTGSEAPPSLLSNEYQGLFPWGKAAGA
jgi:hypothetical protein